MNEIKVKMKDELRRFSDDIQVHKKEFTNALGLLRNDVNKTIEMRQS